MRGCEEIVDEFEKFLDDVSPDQFAFGEEDTRRQGRRSATLLRLQMPRTC